MIIHVVGWTFKADVPAELAREQNAGISKRGEIPVVRSWAFGAGHGGVGQGRRFSHGYIATIDSIDHLAQFERHPIYAANSASIVPLVDPIAVVDLAAEVFDAPPAGRALWHAVMWSFREGTSPVDQRRVLAKAERSRGVPSVRDLAYGPNL